MPDWFLTNWAGRVQRRLCQPNIRPDKVNKVTAAYLVQLLSHPLGVSMSYIITNYTQFGNHHGR